MTAAQVRDLWRVKTDAERMYQLYLVRLQINELHGRVVDACRQIRRYAIRGPGRRAGLFTFSFEVDSLVFLRNYSAAWRQVQLRDEIIRGHRIPLASRRWSPRDFWELTCTYAPLMYFLERYAVGAKLLETALSFWYRRPSAESYQMLFHVYNGDDEPQVLPRVTLTHFYRRMGKDLKEWTLWPVFVGGLAAPLFRITGIERKALLADSSQLATFFAHLMRLRSERVTSGVTRGQADLIEDRAKVKRWQDARRESRKRFDNDPARERTRATLYRHFPELEGLAR
jgi:hypothetical protein